MARLLPLRLLSEAKCITALAASSIQAKSMPRDLSFPTTSSDMIAVRMNLNSLHQHVPTEQEVGNVCSHHGAMMLTLTPLLGVVLLRLLIMPLTPHLLAQYWGLPG